MNIVLLLIFFILSAVYHQPLYFLIPIATLFYLKKSESLRIEINPFTKLYLSLVVVIFGFFIVQSFSELSVKIYSIKGMLRYLTYGLFALYVYKLPIDIVKKYFRYIVLSLFILVPFTLASFDELGRYHSIFRHANHLAYVIIIAIYFLVAHRPFKFLYNTLLTIGLVGMLFLTKTSGALLILVLLIGYNFIISKKVSLRKKLIFIFGPLLLLVPLALQFTDKIYEQIDSLKYFKWNFIMLRVNDFNPGGYGSFIWRLVYWLKIYFTFTYESIFRIFFGVGVDSLTKGNMPYYFMYTDPHNDFLKVLVEFGFVGLALFINFLKNLFIVAGRNINILIIILIPLFFDNAIVNFSFNMSIILLVAYEYKRRH